MVFPAVQSLLDPASLEKAVEALYRLDAPLRCRLVSRGMNDTYLLTAGGQRFALKVARAEHTDAAFAFEPAFIAHLDRVGFAVPAPLATHDGRPFFSVDAPEGPRQIMVTRWLGGTLLNHTTTPEQARQLGTWLARIHQAAASFKPPVQRSVAPEQKIQTRLPALLELVAGDQDMSAFLGRAAYQLRERLTAIDSSTVPRGVCHGDFQYANVMVLADRTIATLDFSDCGEDFIANDLVAFFWHADFDGVGDQLNPAFIAGYDTARLLSQEERAALPLFRAARHVGLACAYAHHVNRIGPIAGFEENLRYYLSMIRLYCAEAGIT